MNSSGECGRMSLELSPVSFGLCFSTDIRCDGSDEYQDLATFRYSIVDLPLLYAAGGREVVCFQGLHFDSALLLSTRTNDCAPRAGVRSFARCVSVY